VSNGPPNAIEASRDFTDKRLPFVGRFVHFNILIASFVFRHLMTSRERVCRVKSCRRHLAAGFSWKTLKVFQINCRQVPPNDERQSDATAALTASADR
jgi:hypothetical protein